MSIGDGGWRLWREGEPLPPALHRQVRGRRQHDHRPLGKAEDGTNYETDFDLIYRKVG
jgi:hypothetical protein